MTPVQVATLTTTDPPPENLKYLSPDEVKRHYTRLQILTHADESMVPVKTCLYANSTFGPHGEGKLDAEEEIEISAFLALCLTPQSTLDVVAVTIRRTPSIVRCLWTRNCESKDGDDIAQAEELKAFFRKEFLDVKKIPSEYVTRRRFMSLVWKYGREKVYARIDAIARGTRGEGIAGKKNKNVWTLTKVEKALSQAKDLEVEDGGSGGILAFAKGLERRALSIVGGKPGAKEFVLAVPMEEMYNVWDEGKVKKDGPNSPDRPVKCDKSHTPEGTAQEIDEGDTAECALKLFRGDIALLKFAKSCKMSLFDSIHVQVQAIQSAVKDLESDVFQKKQSVEFHTWLDIIITLSDDLGNSNLFKRILERIELDIPTLSLYAHLRNLRKTGIYRHGYRRIYNGFNCRAAASIREITVEFVSCVDEGTIVCCEDVRDFLNSEGKRLLRNPNFAMPETSLKRVRAAYRHAPHASLHAELRLALDMRRRGYLSGLIGVSKACCGACTEGLSAFNSTGHKFYVRSTHEKPYLGRLTGDDAVDEAIVQRTQHDFTSWLRRAVNLPDSDEDVSDASDFNDPPNEPADIYAYIFQQKLVSGWEDGPGRQACVYTEQARNVPSQWPSVDGGYIQ